MATETAYQVTCTTSYCCMNGTGVDRCHCTPMERMARAVVYSDFNVYISPDLREAIIDRTNYYGEGAWKRVDLEAMNDHDLCEAYLEALRDYVQGQL